MTGVQTCALPISTTVATDVAAYIAAGRRILFRRGDSWTSTGSIQLSNAGPLTIGAYGDCTTPDDRGICSNAPVLNLSGGVTEGFFNSFNHSDGRIMDLHFIDADNRRAVADGVTGLNRLLYLRLKSEGFETPFGVGHWDTDGHDQLAYVDNDFSVSRNNILYVGSERLMVLGNRLRDPSLSHVLRVWHAYKGVIAHNELSGSSATSNTGRHALKLHGPHESEIQDTGQIGRAHV